MKKHFIIGTAGHVDHGKTMLVKAMTGKDTDRLTEEKKRGISIELGFAPLHLPSGILAGIVDVPGHERFIKNMLAGVGGMDLVLLVIAADEGVMPQTSEHLDIIKLLQVPKGIIVISKIDTVEPDWVELVEEEIKETVKGTVFEEAPVMRISSVTKEGIEELLNYIDRQASEMETRKTSGWPRMPIDRVFTITGFGTVVTGTLVEGSLKVGDPLEILPKGIEARVRNLQVHGKKVDEAAAGQRVAVNLAGIELEDVQRGDVISWPGRLIPSHRIDAKLHLLNTAARPLVNRARVRVHIGTSEILSRVLLLDRDELKPGDTAYVQIQCEEPVIAAKRDRFVIRSYSPMHTIGGGTVIDPTAVKHKRFKKDVIESLATKEQGTPEELILQVLELSGQEVLPFGALVDIVGITESELSQGLDQLKESEKIMETEVEGKKYYLSEDKFQQWGMELKTILREYHDKYPLRRGMPKEEIRSRLFKGINNRLYNALLDMFNKKEWISLIGESIALYGYSPKVGPEHEKALAAISKKFLVGGFQPPGWNDVYQSGKAGDSEELLNYLIDQNILVKLDDNIYLYKDIYEGGKQEVINYLKSNGEITLGEARDLLKSSRKYVLPFLNRLDKDKVTRRVEDKRILMR